MNSQADNKLLECRSCRRLTNQLVKLREQYPDFWNLPVPATGPADAWLMVLGLAPGLKGANRTGIPFTGDASGELLNQVLEDLNLQDQVRITNAVKCLPIKNLPSGRELRMCSKHLKPELAAHREKTGAVIVVLGGQAHRALIAALGYRQVDYPFSHGAVHELAEFTLIDSYHCSRYNTQTGRLTAEMFRAVFETALEHSPRTPSQEAAS